MRKATLALVALACLPLGGAQTEGPGLTFEAPAQIGSLVHATNVTWIFISFQGALTNQVSVHFPQSVLYENVTEFTPMRGHGPIYEGPGPAFPVSPPSSMIPPFSANVAFPWDLASLYIEGESLQVEVNVTRGELGSTTRCVYDLQTAQERSRREARSVDLCPPEGVATLLRPMDEAPVSFRLSGSGVRIVEWHHASVACGGPECPDGGVRREWTAPAGQQSFMTELHGYNRLASQSIELDAIGQALLVAVGAPTIDLAVTGWARLPRATGTGACGECKTNQTLVAEGNLLLRNLHVNPDGTMGASLEGEIDAARFDETSIDPAILTGSAVGAAAATIGVAVILKVLFWPLFTRQTEERVLEHERRRRLYDFVVKNPGVHFREVLRNVGIPSGAGRYHINCLVRAGLLTERKLGSKVRLFEGRQPLRDGWQDFVALRNPEMRLLHDWILNHSDRSQKEILEAFSAQFGWNASTTQGRLARLVRDGMVRGTANGRHRYYAIARPATHPLTLQAATAPALS